MINDPKTILMDVRRDDEWGKENIPQAQHIPMDDLPQNLDKFRNMDGPIVLFCAKGGRAGRAKNYLKEQGIDDVHNGGGIGDVKSQIE